MFCPTLFFPPVGLYTCTIFAFAKNILDEQLHYLLIIFLQYLW